MTTERTPRKPGSGKGQVVQMAADFDAPLELTPDPTAGPPQAKKGPLTAEEQNEIMAQALKDIVRICMVIDPMVEDIYSIAQRALQMVGRI